MSLLSVSVSPAPSLPLFYSVGRIFQQLWEFSLWTSASPNPHSSPHSMARSSILFKKRRQSGGRERDPLTGSQVLFKWDRNIKAKNSVFSNVEVDITVREKDAVRETKMLKKGKVLRQKLDSLEYSYSDMKTIKVYWKSILINVVEKNSGDTCLTIFIETNHQVYNTGFGG